MEKKYNKIPAFNPHNHCVGHSVYMLDCEYQEEAERKLLLEVLSRYIEKDTLEEKK